MIPSIIGSATDIDRGHLEVPLEPFWSACRNALLSVSELSETREVEAPLSALQGQIVAPGDGSAFADGVMTGSALPIFLLDVGSRRVPISLRNALATVVQFWAERIKNPDTLTLAASTAIGHFLAERFMTADVVTGPLRLVAPKRRLPYTFAATMTGERQVYLFIAISQDDMQRLPAIEREVNELISLREWGLWSERKARGLELRRADGTLPSVGDVVIIAIVASASTVCGVLKWPKTAVRVIPLLPDFVTIFDSIEDLAQFDRFWAFHKENSAISGLVGLTDRFAAFHDSHAVLIEGAIAPDLISLDPHWGSNWRYRQLKEFWANAPPLFPFGASASWRSTREGDGLFSLVSRCAHILSWCAVIDRCVVHVVFPMEPDLTLDDGRVLELMVHCLADSLLQRKGTIGDLPLLQRRRINTICHAHRDMLTAMHGGKAKLDQRPLFSEWLGSTTPEGDASAHMQVNLRRVQQRLTSPADASFESEAVLAWIDGLNEILGIERITEEARAAITATANRRPRFSIKVMERRVDVPQFASPIVPRPEHYKMARRDLAIVFKDLGVKEGKYELSAAKAIIDPARDRLRALVHERVGALRRNDLIPFCIEQLDQLTAKYDGETMRLRHSLEHEVGYDRAESLAEAHGTFVRESRNYRYLLECCLSGPSGKGDVTERTITELLATIDWLEVLYGASDVLHNGIDVAGIELDNLYIPHVFYSIGRDQRETEFAKEAAELKLGVGVTPGDEVPEIATTSAEWQRVEAAFAIEVGVPLGQFVAGLVMLSRWPSANQTADLRWSYRATREQLRSLLVESVEGLDGTQADKVISLATLDASGIRRLLGKSEEESDVPIWEHNKRGNRYTIRPLITMEDGSFIWGAAAAERAARIWRSGVKNGYLPADFQWPTVSDAVRNIKERLEEGLELTAHKIVQRGTAFAERGIDFKRRFPGEGFEDVGDYDVLAYWPGKNTWLVIECKYNQPAFCLKDARRLRDRIFGSNHHRAQFAKIERR